MVVTKTTEFMKSLGFERVKFPVGNPMKPDFRYWYIKRMIPYPSQISEDTLNKIIKESRMGWLSLDELNEFKKEIEKLKNNAEARCVEGGFIDGLSGSEFNRQTGIICACNIMLRKLEERFLTKDKKEGKV
jgi:hypothetical protein